MISLQAVAIAGPSLPEPSYSLFRFIVDTLLPLLRLRNVKQYYLLERVMYDALIDNMAEASFHLGAALGAISLRISMQWYYVKGCVMPCIVHRPTDGTHVEQ